MTGFDKAAKTYDNQFSDSETGIRQREEIRNYIAQQEFFQDPKYLLEINCGTGDDAFWLSSIGHDVIATDYSEGMLAEARKKNIQEGKHPPQFLKHDLLTPEWNWPEGTFDAVFSNFSGLNCFDKAELKIIFENITRIMKPGGRLVMVLFGKYCLGETGYFFLRGRFGKAFRRYGGRASAIVEGRQMPVYYYSANEVTSFLPAFRLKKKFGVGLFLPPSYLGEKLNRQKKLMGFAGFLEKLTGHSRLFANLGDHVLLDFEKK
jgi:ubiquinone/menaquinone biosynthesis C-methylase UbiE